MKMAGVCLLSEEKKVFEITVIPTFSEDIDNIHV